MDANIDLVYNDLESIKKDLAFIKNLLSEDYELSDWAKKELANSRKTNTKEYVELDEI